MRKETVVISIDEMPLSLRSPLQFDYIGRMISAAVYEPLFVASDTSGKVLLGSADSCIRSRESREYLFSLDPHKRWSDGRPIEASDFTKVLKRAARHPYWGSFLSDLSLVQSSSPSHLRLVLRKPMAHLPAILATVNFAPWRPHAGNGPFYPVDSVPGVRYDLAPNPYYPGWEHRPNLSFVVTCCVTRLRNALEGVDITCGTAFRFSLLRRARANSSYRCRRSGIFMQLELSASLDVKLREALARAVNRQAIAALFKGGLVAAHHYGAECFRSSRRARRFNPELARKLRDEAAVPQRPLRINFHHYYPNLQIMTLISRQWAKHLGIQTELQPSAFGAATDRKADAALCLRFPPFPHIRASAEIEAYASKGLIIPLFHVPNHYLQSPRVSGFAYPPHACFNFRSIRCQAK